MTTTDDRRFAWITDRQRTVAEFLIGLGLEHFRPYEFLVATDRTGNRLPHSELWPNIAPAALILDRLRAHYGRPVVITSCYRAPNYNRRIGGTPRSQHQAFAAVDFAVAGVAARDVAALLRSWRGEWFRAPRRYIRHPLTVDGDTVPFQKLEWRVAGEDDEFRFAGGVGEYSRFTHVDTRGVNATWSGR